MSKYHVAEAVGRFFVLMDTDANKYSPHVYFNGYDFMGSVNWEDHFSFDYALETREEAEQIIRDLEAADEQPEAPARENAGYQIILSIKTGKDSELVIGKALNPKRPAQYVCWDYSGGDNYNNGGYTVDYRGALQVLANRITSRYDFLPANY